MPFLSLTLYNFRNLANETIDLFAKEVFFVGENGQGKSNLLEALYYSAYASSFRTRIEHEVVKNGENEMSLNALFKSNISTDSVSVKYENGRKRIEKNRKRVNDRKDLINTIPCVLFSHGDIEFASGEPERRRFFIDQSLSMYDIVHLEALRRYRYVLKSRNTCIRERNLEMLSSYDKKMSDNMKLACAAAMFAKTLGNSEDKFTVNEIRDYAKGLNLDAEELLKMLNNYEDNYGERAYE